MSEKTRIKRPTTATPRKFEGRMVHQSTNYVWVTPNPSVAAKFVKATKGDTYRRPK